MCSLFLTGFDYLIARHLSIILIPAANTHSHTHTHIFVCMNMSKKPSDKAKTALLRQQQVLVVFQIQQAGAHLVLPPDRRKALLPAPSVDDVLKAISI